MDERQDVSDPMRLDVPENPADMEIVRVGRWSVVGSTGMRVRAYEGGPVLVTCAGEVLSPDGERTPCSRATVAICRCGQSRLGPFCDGTHRFVAPSRRDAADRLEAMSDRPSTPA